MDEEIILACSGSSVLDFYCIATYPNCYHAFCPHLIL